MNMPTFETQVVAGNKTNFENTVDSLAQSGWVMEPHTFRITGESEDTYHVLMKRVVVE